MNSKKSKLMKVLALILAICAIATGFTACGKKSGSGKVPKEFQGKQMEQYIKLICSENYTYETAPMKGGKTGGNIFYAKADEDNALVTFQVVSKNQTVPCTIMLKKDENNGDNKKGQYYVVFSSEGIYAPVPNGDQNAVSRYAATMEKLSLDYLMSDSFVGSGKVSYMGQTYSYEDYANANRGVRNRFFFDQDGNLKMMGKVDGSGKVNGLASISIYETNSSVFTDVYSFRAVDYYSLFPGDVKTASK